MIGFVVTEFWIGFGAGIGSCVALASLAVKFGAWFLENRTVAAILAAIAAWRLTGRGE